MIIKTLHCILFLLSTPINVLAVGKPRVVYNPEKVLVGFSFDHGKLKTEDEIIREYGNGCVAQYSRKYGIAEGKQIVEFYFQGDARWLIGIGVYYSTEEKNDCALHGNIGAIKSGNGLILGDSEDKVYKLYGSPMYIRSTEKTKHKTGKEASLSENHTLYYRDDIVYKNGGDSANGVPPYSQLRIEICKKKVCRIGVSISNWSDTGMVIPRVYSKAEKTQLENSKKTK